MGGVDSVVMLEEAADGLGMKRGHHGGFTIQGGPLTGCDFVPSSQVWLPNPNR